MFNGLGMDDDDDDDDVEAEECIARPAPEGEYHKW